MYTPQEFSFPELDGISARTMEAHLGLYAGYVKNVNHIHDKIAAYKQDAEGNKYAISELQRRLGFEFGGMKNHEAYFAQFVGGPHNCPAGAFMDLVNNQFGSLDAFVEHLKTIANTRGVGWAMCYHDQSTKQLVCTWVDEQHLGHLVDVDIVLALDMWEHSYLLDRLPSEKGAYIDAFFTNLNWEVVAARV